MRWVGTTLTSWRLVFWAYLPLAAGLVATTGTPGSGLPGIETPAPGTAWAVAAAVAAAGALVFIVTGRRQGQRTAFTAWPWSRDGPAS